MLNGALVLLVACGGGEQPPAVKTAGIQNRTEVQRGEKSMAGTARPEAPSADSQPAVKTSENRSAKPHIEITSVPPKGAGGERMERISGSVSGADTQKCKVVIFAHTDVWYVQPYDTDPHTPINDNGHWENDTHLGREYAALLVKSDYKPPRTTGKLPPISGAVLAIAVEAAR
jgi:hypothetical protein